MTDATTPATPEQLARIEKFPSLKKAFIEMSYDNGGINRGRTEQDAIDATRAVLLDGDHWADEELTRFDEWIATLTAEQISMLVAGEETEMKNLISGGLFSPDHERLDTLLNELFDVC